MTRSDPDLVPLTLVPVEVFGGCDHPDRIGADAMQRYQQYGRGIRYWPKANPLGLQTTVDPTLPANVFVLASRDSDGTLIDLQRTELRR